MRLVEKQVVQDEKGHARMRRRYDQARTPFDRPCATKVLSTWQRENLERLREATNPRQLRQSIYDQLDALWRLPGAVPGKPEDVFRKEKGAR